MKDDEKYMIDISDDIILDKSEKELKELDIFIMGERAKIISIKANDRSLSFIIKNNTYIINVSDDNGKIATIKIKNFDKKKMEFLSGSDNNIDIFFYDKGDE